MSAWELPTTVEVAGRSFAIRSDFRAVLDALAALTDPDLTQQEQYVACLQILYPRWKELPDADALHRQRKSPPWCAACGGRKLMIVIDGEQFKIDVLSVKRSADFLDKYAERLANGHLRRELIGVYFNYKLQFGPGLDRKEYARLWDKLTEPVEFHEVTVPDEDGDYTFTAYFSNVGDELLRKKAEKNYWKNLTANFIAQKPART